MVKPSKKALEIKYNIRELISISKELLNKGERVISLASGDPAKYDFRPPSILIEALKSVIEDSWDFHSYGSFEGEYFLREAIAEFESAVIGKKMHPDDIIVTSGSIRGIANLMLGVLEPGEKILLPNPYYPPYVSLAKLYGFTPVFYNLREELGWLIDIDEFRKILERERPKVVVLINPNNPTGKVYPPKLVKEIGDITVEYDAVLIVDEVYDRITFTNDYRKSPTVLSDDVNYAVLGSFSKTLVVPGWRVGFVYFSKSSVMEEIKKALKKVQMLEISGVRITQLAIAIALRKRNTVENFIRNYVRELNRRRKLAIKLINEIDEFSLVEPDGAFYLFPKIESRKWKNKDYDFVIELLNKEKVLIVHGSGFGKLGENHIRLVFLPRDEVLIEAVEKIKRVLG